MDLKKRIKKKYISYQWRIFLPVVICLWAMIFGMFKWQLSRIRDIRDEMAFDQLNVVGTRLVASYERGDLQGAQTFAEFANRFYDDSKSYDPMCVWVQDLQTGEIVDRVGDNISEEFDVIPTEKSGSIIVPKEMLTPNFGRDTRFLYSTYVSPTQKKRLYVLLPYTKRLQDVLDQRTAYYWLIFVGLGLLVTLLTYISSVYLSRNIKLLRNFAYQASTNPNMVIRDDHEFPHDELGDISREIMNIYRQRTQEIARREREHEIALNAIVEKERIKRELTGNINHELKTPVGVIQGYLDTIVESPDLPAEMRESFLVKAQQNVHRLSALINDITAITKLESGGKLINITDVDFHDLVFAFDNLLKEGNVLQGKMIFAYELPLNCKVMANEQLLQTVLLNFVKNSVAYSEGTECHLLLTDEDEDFYYFRYYDNGIGVPPEHLPHMFERFYRVNQGRARNTGGTGLGLAIVEVTIESFGGKIEVLNHFPTGLEYNFSLPKYKKKTKPENPEDSEDSSK